MVHKYAKLVINLGNAVQAVCGLGEDTAELGARAREEGRAILTAAGIAHEVAEVADRAGRHEQWHVTDIPGYPRGGGSTWQSVTRGTPVESDYLNGEIVLQARLLGLQAPVNAALQQLAQETIAGRHRPGWKSAAEVLAPAGATPAH